MKNSLDSLNKMLDMRIKKFCELNDNSTESRLHCAALHRYCASYKLKVCGDPVLSKSVGAIFPTAFPHSMSLCHILVILTIFKNFPLLLHLLWWSVISDLTTARRLWLTEASDDCWHFLTVKYFLIRGFSGGSDSKESACNAGDIGLIPGAGRSPGKGNGNSLQYSCLENSVDRGAWWATVHGVAKRWTWLND